MKIRSVPYIVLILFLVTFMVLSVIEGYSADDTSVNWVLVVFSAISVVIGIVGFSILCRNDNRTKTPTSKFVMEQFTAYYFSMAGIIALVAALSIGKSDGTSNALYSGAGVGGVALGLLGYCIYLEEKKR